MNTQKIARGWALIAEGAMELSLAYESIEQPVARAGAPLSSAPAESAGVPPTPADDLPPFEEPPNVQEAYVNTALGVCPVHKTAWTVKQGGVSKAGKPYNAFWKCSQRDASGYCSQKPVKAWIDSHPIQEAA